MATSQVQTNMNISNNELTNIKKAYTSTNPSQKLATPINTINYNENAVGNAQTSIAIGVFIAGFTLIYLNSYHFTERPLISFTWSE